MADRFKDAEKLSKTVRDELPSAAVMWLAALRGEMQKLTTAALSGDVSDEDFRDMVQRTSKRLPDLLTEMDHDALANLMETGMGAAMGNGIARRVEDFEHRTAKQEKRAKLPWDTDVFLAGNDKHDERGRFARKNGSGMNLRGAKWEGSPKEMQQRAAAAMKSMPVMQHPGSGVEMKITSDGIRKSLHSMRSPHEFMAAARLTEIYLNSEKSAPMPDRQGRPEIQAFHSFTAAVSFGRRAYQAEIITKQIVGQDVHHLKMIRLK